MVKSLILKSSLFVCKKFITTGILWLKVVAVVKKSAAVGAAISLITNC